MKFEDIKFPGKNKIYHQTIYEIKEILYHSVVISTLSELAIDRYLEILITDQHFNPRTNTFYDQTTHTELTCELLANIAHDYIIEHIDEFQKKI